MIRDRIKDAKYFEEYIAYQADRIFGKKEKLAACMDDDAKADRIRLSLLHYQLDMIFAKFSNGEGKREIEKVLEESLNTAAAMAKVDYESLMNLLSIAILYDVKKEAVSLIHKHRDAILGDKLLNCLAQFIENGARIWDGKFLVKTAFDRLNDFGISLDKETVMQSYLEAWYDLHNDAAWYDSHKNQNDTYVGYWCFEGAALARVFALDSRKLNNNKCFPDI